MKKILIIEDNLEVRENTMEILTLANYNVISAESGKIGVEVAQQERPDLIICDIMMPELDGYGVLHILSKNEETAGIPFIFLSAKSEKSDVRKGMDLGADDYLTKPFDDTDLLNAIEARLKKFVVHQKQYDISPEGLDNLISDAQKILNIKDLGKDKKIKTFKKKVEIFSEGDQPLNVFFVKSGNVKTFKSNQDSKELILNLYTANDFFGYEAVLENVNYSESAVAMQDCELIVIPRADFTLLIQSHPDISKSFINLLCKKVSEREGQLLNLAYNSIRQRTAEALLKSDVIKDSKSIIAITREDLSKMVGTASESVIRVLSDFKQEGLIEIEGGKIRILQALKLEKVVLWNVVRKMN
jgi:CRP-like cAMP-binding protein/FixJ family two-component response regulator